MNKAFRFATILGISSLFLETACLSQVQTYCTNVAGNIACTSYDHGASSQSYCTSIAGNLSCTTYDDASNRIQIRQNYEVGQVIETVLGNTIFAAIDTYKTNKRAKQARQDQWNQFVQDTLATTELACEADPKHEVSVLGCRKAIFSFNQFLQAHQRDFVPDGRNIELLAKALERTATDDESLWTEQTYETAFQAMDKKQLDKKVYVGFGKDRSAW